ncbi:MAG TPA: class II aldolase/adducin family protein [Candidatus Ratteibacteria bacterium]|nr:class II aldolase/adducin family protein [Candidatus Ratteibacteria bacterium]
MENIREKLTEYGKKIVEKKLVAGSGGNISAREGNFVYLSPSGFFLDDIKKNEWVKVDIKTGEIYGGLKPTCEISTHLGIYKEREDVKVVFHTHPPLTVGLISSGMDFKPFFPDFVAVLGKEIPVIDYVPPGGEEMRKRVVEKIKNSNVVLIRNHGAICVGETFKEAFARAWMVEDTAKSLIASLISGKLRYFTKKEIEGIENLESEDYRKAILKKME